MPSPLHPAIVHFPIVLAFLLPVAAVASLIVARRDSAESSRPRSSWALVATLAVFLSVSAWVAVETGQQQEDTVESVVAENAIHDHEEVAEGLLLGAVVLSAVILLGFSPGRTGSALRYLSVAGSVVVLGLAFRTGASGGDLVYVHGAASAYTSGSAITGGVPTGRVEARGDDDDDDGDRDRH